MEDLDDVPDEVKEEITFKPMKTVDDVLNESLNIKLPKPEHLDINVEQINRLSL